MVAQVFVIDMVKDRWHSWQGCDNDNNGAA